VAKLQCRGRPLAARLSRRAAVIRARAVAPKPTPMITLTNDEVGWTFGDGFVALLLPIYLVERGFSVLAIGAIVTGTLIGTAVMTLWVGWIANRQSRRLLLLSAAVLMVATGVGFAAITDFWPLLVIAVAGTMNPTSGDARIFVPLEQTVLTQTIESRRRTALFARYSVIGSCATALGVLATALPDFATAWTGCSRSAAMQLMFGLYAVLGLVAFLLYRPLSQSGRRMDRQADPPRRLYHGLLQRDGSCYAYRLTPNGVQVALLFLFFHKRLCGPLANSRSHHCPDTHHKPASKLEAVYHRADKAIQQIVDLLAA